MGGGDDKPSMMLAPAVNALDATENDVVRVFSHVVMHRVRVRDGPHDEVMGSYAFGALRGHQGDEPFPETDPSARPTIAHVLKEIVAAV